MKIKKLVLTAISYVTVAAIAIGGTMAYLTSEDSDVNVMTLGNVKIAQHEYQRVVNEDGSYATKEIDGKTSYVLEAFEQGKSLLPSAIITNGPDWDWDSTTVRMSQVDSYGGMQVFKTASNAQDKFVTVENTGKSDAYVRTLVAIEIGSGNAELIAIGRHNTWTANKIGSITIDGNNYFVYEFIYAGGELSDGSWRHENGVLPAGDTSYPNLAQVYLKAETTNEDIEKIDGNKNGTLDILVLSQAVQTAGFADAKTALDTAFGKSSEKVAEWFNGKDNVQYAEAGSKKATVLGEDAAQLLEALEDGKDLIVDKDMDILGFDTNEVDAQGATVTLNGTGSEAYGYLAFLPEASKDVTVSNLNVTGSGFVEVGHWGMGGGKYTVNNLVVKDLASTLANGDKGFTLACAFCHYGNATLNDCVMTGATAITEGALPVDAGFVNDTTTVVNGGKYGTIYCWSHSVVTINDAEVDEIYAAPIKGTVTIKADAKVGTINVAYGTSSPSPARIAKLIIEDGAEVGAIVHGGNTYTVAQWKEYVANAQ